MENLHLRLLQPEKDFDLYRQVFTWRTPKKHTSTVRIDFETFTEINPTHLTVGLFNGELIGIYFLREYEPRHFEAHFTSKKGTSREALLEGAKELMDLILTNGGEEVVALILPVNKPLRRFVAQLGMTKVGYVKFTCVEATQGSSIQERNQRMFVKYAKRA